MWPGRPPATQQAAIQQAATQQPSAAWPAEPAHQPPPPAAAAAAPPGARPGRPAHPAPLSAPPAPQADPAIYGEVARRHPGAAHRYHAPLGHDPGVTHGPRSPYEARPAPLDYSMPDYSTVIDYPGPAADYHPPAVTRPDLRVPARGDGRGDGRGDRLSGRRPDSRPDSRRSRRDNDRDDDRYPDRDDDDHGGESRFPF